jgi:CheY-like chemotaxis protein
VYSLNPGRLYTPLAMIILYAEDDPEDADVFKEAVKSIDPTIGCIIAKDGKEAIEILENAVILPDYIFLDVNMPLLGGRECLTQIKNRKELKNIPVIIYTTSNRQNDVKDFKSLGATEYIVKPNSFSQVLSSLSKILNVAL